MCTVAAMISMMLSRQHQKLPFLCCRAAQGPPTATKRWEVVGGSDKGGPWELPKFRGVRVVGELRGEPRASRLIGWFGA